MLPKPQLLSFERWAAQVLANYPESEVPVPPAEERWREWATSLLRREPFNEVPLAHPDDFSDWRDWAEHAALVLGAG